MIKMEYPYKTLRDVVSKYELALGEKRMRYIIEECTKNFIQRRNATSEETKYQWLHKIATEAEKYIEKERLCLLVDDLDFGG